MIRLTSDNPYDIAQEFLIRRYPCGPIAGCFEYRHHFYIWQEGRWRQKSVESLRKDLNLWLSQVEIETERTTRRGTEIVVERYTPTLQSVSMIMQAISSHAFLEEDLSVPMWLGNDSPQVNLSHTIAFNDVLVDIAASAKAGKYVTVERDWRWFDPVIIPVNFDPDATCDLFDRSMNEWSQNDDNWKELQLRRMGYTLMSTRKYSRGFFQIGKPRAGKGTLEKLEDALMGHEGRFTNDLDQLAGPHGMQGAENARSITITEVNDLTSAKGQAVARLCKAIWGEDIIPINPKNKPLMNVRVPAVITLSGNMIPTIPDSQQSFWSKVCFIPFKTSYLGKENFSLAESLREELPGIAMRVVAAAMRLEAESDPAKKWPVPTGAQTHRDAAVAYGDPVEAFLHSKCEPDPDKSVSKAIIWSTYLAWCKEEEMDAMAQNQFWRRVWNSSWPIKRYQKLVGTKQQAYVRGLRLSVRGIS